MHFLPSFFAISHHCCSQTCCTFGREWWKRISPGWKRKCPCKHFIVTHPGIHREFPKSWTSNNNKFNGFWAGKKCWQKNLRFANAAQCLHRLKIWPSFFCDSLPSGNNALKKVCFSLQFIKNLWWRIHILRALDGRKTSHNEPYWCVHCTSIHIYLGTCIRKVSFSRDDDVDCMSSSWLPFSGSFFASNIQISQSNKH
jgi:hypothetical protein